MNNITVDFQNVIPKQNKYCERAKRANFAKRSEQTHYERYIPMLRHIPKPYREEYQLLLRRLHFLSFMNTLAQVNPDFFDTDEDRIIEPFRSMLAVYDTVIEVEDFTKSITKAHKKGKKCQITRVSGHFIPTKRPNQNRHHLLGQSASSDII
jgi:hypothetical protein